jgi:hypothetical protein
MGYTQRLGGSVNGIPASFVFKLDEFGFQGWADRRESKVVVRSGSRDDGIMVLVERGANRNSLLVCSAAGGTHLKPLLILPRKTIDRELTEHGITSAICKMVHHEQGFVTSEIFDEWC